MRIVVAGASGFLGGPLLARLRAEGHQVTQLVRREPARPDQLRWDPARDLRLPEGTDAIVNLCGAGVADHRWTKAYKEVLWSSRVVPTTTLAKAAAQQGVRVLVNAGGVATYGDRGDEVLTEESPTRTGAFLEDLAVAWEGAALLARPARVVRLRTGLPLHASGGLLKPLVLAFKLGVGGKLGDGRQWMPWVSREDWVRAVLFSLTADVLDGPLNVAGPVPATNADFTRELGRVLHRPAIFPIPKFGVRLVIGQFGDEAFKSTKMAPEALRRAGFVFEHATVGEALVAAVRK
ncbi:MAG: TIGR01777 family protein [Hamadaea sp.]|nr:TIGR01777 family protein [Hamadaea sp.]